MATSSTLAVASFCSAESAPPDPPAYPVEDTFLQQLSH